MMIKLHPEYLSKNGKKEFVVLPYEEFAALQELLEDLEDLEDLRNAKLEDADKPSISLAEVKKELGLSVSPTPAREFIPWLIAKVG